VLINLCEQIIPTSDESTLALISNEFKLIFGPAVFNASDKLFKNHFTPSFGKDFVENLVVLDQVSLPKVQECEVLEVDFDFQLGQQVFPMARFHSLRLKFKENVVYFSVLLELRLVLIIDVMRS
jgi:hypothetical protein